ncbi:MAG: hypothetical protein AAF862_05690 [Pseudomonadota bacterium]
MKIAGQSFAFLTQLSQDNQNKAASGADERIAKRAAVRAQRIEAARAAQRDEVRKVQGKSFKDELSAKTGRSRSDFSGAAKREALGARPQTPPPPGNVVNILI